MSDKKPSLKHQLDHHESFKDQYFKIINDFKYEQENDSNARNHLSHILYQKAKKNPFNLDKILYHFRSTIQSKENILIFGCGPTLERTLNWLIKTCGPRFHNKINANIIAADGASSLLRKNNVPIHSIFTDLDGITEEEFKYPKFIIIHAHGDNIDKIKQFKSIIINFNNLIGTTPVNPLENVLSPGGFTDGDRILYFLRSVISSRNRIFFIGMDFGTIVGRYSKPHLTENLEGGPNKVKKLKWAVRLIENILPDFQNEIYFVNSSFVSDIFQYLSLEEFKRKLEF